MQLHESIQVKKKIVCYKNKVKVLKQKSQVYRSEIKYSQGYVNSQFVIILQERYLGLKDNSQPIILTYFQNLSAHSVSGLLFKLGDQRKSVLITEQLLCELGLGRERNLQYGSVISSVQFRFDFDFMEFVVEEGKRVHEECSTLILVSFSNRFRFRSVSLLLLPENRRKKTTAFLRNQVVSISAETRKAQRFVIEELIGLSFIFSSFQPACIVNWERRAAGC